MEGFINSIGGYESWQLATLIILMFIVGGSLMTVHWIFTVCPIFGGVLIVDYLQHIIATNPDLPSWLQVVPTVFVLFILLGIFVTLSQSHDLKNSKKEVTK